MRSARRPKLIALESLRGVAALSILVYHAAYQPLRLINPAIDPYLAPFGLYAVPLFFVLSAFVLWYGYADNGRVRGGAGHFYRRRFFRIAPLFYVVLVVHLVWVYSVAWPLERVLGEIFFAFNLQPGLRGGFVLAGWSIGVEMLFYAIFPLLVHGIRHWTAVVALLGGATALTAFRDRDVPRLARMAEFRTWNIPQIDAYASIEYCAVFFSAGLLAAFVLARTGRSHQRIGRLLLGVALVAMVLLGLVNAHDLLAWRPIWAVVLAGFVYAVAVAPPRVLEHPVMQWIGERSFSVYLTHPLVLLAMDNLGWVNALDRSLGWGGYPATVAVALVSTLSISAVTYRFIEQPGMKLGGRPAVGSSSHAPTVATP